MTDHSTSGSQATVADQPSLSSAKPTAVVAAVRSFIAYAFVSTYVLILGGPALLLAILLKWPGLLYRLGFIAVKVALAIAGVRYRLAGAERVLTGRAAVYFFNHVSNVDPPVVFLTLRRIFPRLRVLYKKELRKLPILRQAFDVVGFVPVDRGNREQTAQAIDAASRALQDGYSFLLAPEGTRSWTGQLLPFKKGGFILAIRAQSPVIPVVVIGAGEAMRKGSLIVRPVQVSVRIGQPIETTGLTLDDRDRLMATVRAQMEDLLAAGPI